MSNPLMCMMDSVLNMGKANPINNIMGNMNQVKNILGMITGSQRNPQQIVQMLSQKNPQFAQFMKQCEGKSAEQLCNENGLDINQMRQMLGQFGVKI